MHQDRGPSPSVRERCGERVVRRELERARRLSAEEQLGNVTYEDGDAQVHPFATGHYDLAISRFGVMFFADPSPPSATSPAPCGWGAGSW